MKKFVFIISSLILMSLLAVFVINKNAQGEGEVRQSYLHAKIYPEYNGVTIPPNIAPLNFKVLEDGEHFKVTITPENGKALFFENKDGVVRFAEKEWKKMLRDNIGQQFTIDISVLHKGQRTVFQTITNTIAPHKIDSHLAYRLLNSSYTKWSDMGIYQRDLESFVEKPVITNQATDGKCMNCHSFNKNDPNTMMMHLRGGEGSGTLILTDGKVRKVNTATDFNRAGAYPAWHPSGTMIAYSVNKLEMYFHGLAQEPRDVLDRGSDIILYFIDENVVTTSPQIASIDRMETFPWWSPDGKYLYFCSCPDFNTFIEGDEFHFDKIQYDLYRIPYNSDSRQWGESELVLSGTDIGKSITFPRISPDGKYLMCCMADDGHFPIYKPSADLYMVDLETFDYKRLDINSDQGDTYHTWSSDGRWFVFSSKRMDGLLARPHFAYVDPDGNIHKPFVLPQKNPMFYKSFLKTYNRPELITGPITVRPQQFVKTAYDNKNRFDARLDQQVLVREKSKDSENINLAPN
jgi:hypothetical protein